MAGQKTYLQRQHAISVTTFGAKEVRQLRKGNIAREMLLRLAGTLTYAAAAQNIASTLARGDEWALIDRLDIVVNASTVIRQFYGWQLKAFNHVVYASWPTVSPFLGDGATAAPAFDSTIAIPFWLPFPFAQFPMDTALDTSQLQDFRIEITFAAAAAINSANPPTAVAATLEIATYESAGVALKNTDLRIYNIFEAVSAANAALPVQLPVNKMYRGFLINFAAAGLPTSADIAPYNRATGAANAAYNTATGITNVALKSGPYTYRDIPAQMLLDWTRQRDGITKEINPNAAQTGVPSLVNPPFVNPSRSTAFREDGWIWLDLCQDGYNSEAVDALGLTELYLEFNVAAAGQITVMPFELTPPRG